LSWQAKRFIFNTENEAVARKLRTPNCEVEDAPTAVHMNRYAAIAALGDYHCGSARLASIDLPFVAVGLAVMAGVGGVLAFIPVVLFSTFVMLAARSSRRFRDMLHDRTVQDNKKYDFITEVLSGIHNVKAMAIEPQMQRRFERLQQAVAETTMSSILTGQSAQTSAFLYGSVSQLVVVSLGAWRVIDEQLSIGALACCTMLSGQILQPSLRAISQWVENQTIRRHRQDIRVLLDTQEIDASSAEWREIKGDVVFDQVTFARGRSADLVKYSAHFSVPAGSIIGIQGRDGSGRTTMVNLLCGEIKPTSGDVMIDGISTVAPDFVSIRQRIITVGSAPVTFRGTIMENLTVFQAEKRDLARKMCRVVGVDAYIDLLPDGYETRIGEDIADDLPTSVAQQLNIVRALTCDPKILVLDEANTVLDIAAEQALLRAVKSLRGHLTMFVVSHRPSLLALADALLVIQDGHGVLRPVSSPGRSFAGAGT
jgi:ATP-binding cassette subfamily C protein LapB